MARFEKDPEDIVEEALDVGRHAPAPIDDIVGMEQYNSLPRRILVIEVVPQAFVPV